MRSVTLTFGNPRRTCTRTSATSLGTTSSSTARWLCRGAPYKPAVKGHRRAVDILHLDDFRGLKTEPGAGDVRVEILHAGQFRHLSPPPDLGHETVTEPVDGSLDAGGQRLNAAMATLGEELEPRSRVDLEETCHRQVSSPGWTAVAVSRSSCSLPAALSANTAASKSGTLLRSALRGTAGRRPPAGADMQ